MAKTPEILRKQAQEALEKARKLESEAKEQEAKIAQEAAVAEANRVIHEKVREAIAAILTESPLPAGKWTLTAIAIEDNAIGEFSLVVGNGNGHKSSGNGKGSAGNAFARPSYNVPEGHGLYIVDGEGNIVEVDTLDEACDKLGLAHWCKGGNMEQKGDAPGRVLYKYAGENPDRVLTRVKG